MARIAVIGPGAIGVAFTAALQDTGRHEIVLCGRRRRDKLALRDGDREVVIDGPVVTDPAEAPQDADLVLLAVKSHQTAGAEPWLRRFTGGGSPEGHGAGGDRDTVVAVLQNGVEHVDRVAPFTGPGAEILPAVVFCPAEPIGGGVVQLNGPRRLTVAAGPAAGTLAGAFEGSSAEIVPADDIDVELWTKLCMNALGCLMPLAGRRAGMFAALPAMRELGRRLLAECRAVAASAGVPLDPRDVEGLLTGLMSRDPGLGSSILFDREAGRPLEWDALVGVVRRTGAHNGVPTPVCDVLVPLLEAASGEFG